MTLADWRNDEKLTGRIAAAVKGGKLSHAYIIEADMQTDKTEFAKDFLKAVNCRTNPGIGCCECVSCRKIEHDNCEDLYFVHADGLSIKDKDIFALQEKLKTKPIGELSMAIIADADTMTVRAQNRLLKTLEEPPGNSILLLLSENKENLLETVRSRCIAYRLNGSAETEGYMQEAAEEVVNALLDGEKFFYIKQILSKNVKKREDAYGLLDGMEKLYREFILDRDPRGRRLKSEDMIAYVGLIEEARRDLTANVNYNYALKDMILKIGGIYG